MANFIQDIALYCSLLSSFPLRQISAIASRKNATYGITAHTTPLPDIPAQSAGSASVSGNTSFP